MADGTNKFLGADAMTSLAGGRPRWFGAMALVFLAPMAGAKGDEPAAERPPAKYPSLPGAVAEMPGWVGEHAPFDVARYFDAPPREQNAAPMYLNALFEFGPEMAACFPPGEETERRQKAAQDRMEAMMPAFQAFTQAPDNFDVERLEKAVAPYEEGFRKLAMAQTRKRCVFQSGLGIMSLIPHAQSCRQVARVAQMRVRLALNQGDLPAAIRDVETTLRLSRDLQPRGYIINQLVAVAMDNVVAKEMILPILAAPGLKAEHCDRLLLALADHEALSVDMYAEGLRAEYLMARLMLEDLVHRQDKLAKELGVEPGGSILSKLDELTHVMSALAGPNAAGGGGGNGPPQFALPKFTRLRNKATEARLARTSAGELAARVAKLNAFYRTQFDLGSVPMAERLRRMPEPKSVFGDDPLDKILLGMSPATGAFTQAVGRHEALLHAADGLIALRRWQLGHDAPPPDLLAAVKEAGMPAVPVDPYDGKPMRMALVEGTPVVYSIGKDGVDDGGLVDSKFDAQPGDQLYKLPPPKAEP